MADEKNTGENIENTVTEETQETAETAEDRTEASEENAAPESGEGEAAAQESVSLLADISELFETALISVFVLVLVITYLLHPVNIIGHSMVPTLNKSYDETQVTDKIFMTTVYTGIRYGDIVIIDENENHLLNENGEAYVPDQSVSRSLNECIIKRVIAVGGQTIDIRDSQVIVDGEVLDEPYIASGATTADLGAFTGQYPITVPEGYLFVMGDNRNNSCDSRDQHVGLVSEDQIYGKAVVRFYPLSEFKWLTGSWKESADD
ncbi:MAG: signal peptidase I [Ruminococcus sp.]|nr:signal peptidase I [Ruminococcus sp.]